MLKYINVFSVLGLLLISQSGYSQVGGAQGNQDKADIFFPHDGIDILKVSDSVSPEVEARPLESSPLPADSEGDDDKLAPPLTRAVSLPMAIVSKPQVQYSSSHPISTPPEYSQRRRVPFSELHLNSPPVSKAELRFPLVVTLDSLKETIDKSYKEGELNDKGLQATYEKLYSRLRYLVYPATHGRPEKYFTNLQVTAKQNQVEQKKLALANLEKQKSEHEKRLSSLGNALKSLYNKFELLKNKRLIENRNKESQGFQELSPEPIFEMEELEVDPSLLSLKDQIKILRKEIQELEGERYDLFKVFSSLQAAFNQAQVELKDLNLEYLSLTQTVTEEDRRQLEKSTMLENALEYLQTVHGLTTVQLSQDSPKRLVAPTVLCTDSQIR